MNPSLISHILPPELVKYFTIISITELCNISDKSTFLDIIMEEKNNLPEGLDFSEYESKGFSSSKRIQDFPLRGKAVFLNIKVRRWRHKQSREEIKSDYSFVAEGAKLTKELADFLKGTGRVPRRYD